MNLLKSLPILFGLTILLPQPTDAAIDPRYKECMQRGYTVSGDSCVFPDNSRCLLEDFNSGACGSKWMTQGYCIPQGKYVWDAEKCCKGLVAYLPEGMAGQATCQPKGATFFRQFFLDSFAGMALLVVLLIIVLIFLRRKKREN